jgi:hypothetical protein
MWAMIRATGGPCEYCTEILVSRKLGNVLLVE